MPRNQDEKTPERSRGPLGISRSELLKLAILVVLAAVFTNLWLSDFQGGGGGPVAPDTEVPSTQPGSPGTNVAVNPWAPPVRVLNERIRQRSRADRVQNYPEALSILATLVRNRPYNHFLLDETYADVRGFDPVPVEKLKDPGSSLELRARPVEVAGEFKSGTYIGPADLGLDPEGFKQLYRGVLSTSAGPVEFLLFESGDQKEGGLKTSFIPGRRYKVHGVFYRVRDVRKTEERDGEKILQYVTRPVVLAKEVFPVVPLKLREELPEDLEASIEDARDVNSVQPPPQNDWVFYELLGYILYHWDKLPPPDAEVRWLEPVRALDRPEDYRLDYVQVRGELIYKRWESFRYKGMREGDAPLLGYWHLMVYQNNLPVSVLLPQEKLPEGISVGSVIKVPGLFWRVHAYRSKGQGRVRNPLVIATKAPVDDFVRFRPPDNIFIIGLMVGMGGLFAALLAMLVRDRRRARQLEDRLRRQRRERHRQEGVDLNRLQGPRDGPGGDATPSGP